MHQTQVQSLLRKDFTCHRKPVRHDYSSPRTLKSACAPKREATAVRSPHPAAREQPLLAQPEKARAAVKTQHSQNKRTEISHTNTHTQKKNETEDDTKRRYTVFVDWKIIPKPLQAIYRFNAIAITISMAFFFYKTRTNNSKICMETQKIPNYQSNLERRMGLEVSCSLTSDCSTKPE